jgi:hypothetical protein
MFLCGNVDSAAQEQPTQRKLTSVARAIISIPEAVLVNEFSSGENAGVVYYVSIPNVWYYQCRHIHLSLQAICATLGDFTWVIRRRYRDFSKLHRKVKKFNFPAVFFGLTSNQLIAQCPEYAVEDIPSKTIFRASPDLVSRRRLQLEKFLQGIVRSEPLATSDCTLQVSVRLYYCLQLSS